MAGNTEDLIVQKKHREYLIYNHTRRLQMLREQQAVAGLSVEPKIVIEIEDIEAIVSSLQIQLDEINAQISARSASGADVPSLRNTALDPPAPSKRLVMVPDDDLPPKYPGLILLVGIGRPNENPMHQSAGHAIQYHMASAPDEVGLRVCWLICSSGEEGSFPIAQKLQKACQNRKLSAFLKTVDNPFSLQESYDVVQHIYSEKVPQAGLSEAEVIADYTGGVKPMSVGMALACGHRRPMQYMTGRKKSIASVPMLMKFQP